MRVYMWHELGCGSRSTTSGRPLVPGLSIRHLLRDTGLRTPRGKSPSSGSWRMSDDVDFGVGDVVSIESSSESSSDRDSDAVQSSGSARREAVPTVQPRPSRLEPHPVWCAAEKPVTFDGGADAPEARATSTRSSAAARSSSPSRSHQRSTPRLRREPSSLDWNEVRAQPFPFRVVNDCIAW